MFLIFFMFNYYMVSHCMHAHIYIFNADQSKAMEAAIKDVFPETTHRWCRWHVLRKAKEHLGDLYTRRSGFKQEFHKIINSMLTIEEFEYAWQLMLVKYKLQNNSFLSQIYENRSKWAKPYFKGKFCAGQTSTQRSESGNSMLKRYVGSSCPMHQFVQMYQQLQFDREEKESIEEQASKLVSCTVGPKLNSFTTSEYE